MNEVKTFFRYCPDCGKRFHVKLVNKKLVRDAKETRVHKEVASSARVFTGSRFQPISPVVLEVDVPVIIEIEDIEYSYRCGHCGRVWTEMHRREEEVEK